MKRKTYMLKVTNKKVIDYLGFDNIEQLNRHLKKNYGLFLFIDAVNKKI